MRAFLTLCSLVSTLVVTVEGAELLPPNEGVIVNDGSCYLPADIVILQDTTGSFMDDMPVVRGQIPEMIKQVGVQFPGTRFGIAEFRDKPYFPMGELTDFCYKLRYGELTDNEIRLQFAWDILEPSGGGDTYEAQYQAGIDICYDQNIGWRPLVDGAYNVETKSVNSAKLQEAIQKWAAGDEIDAVGAHIVVMITDAEPHLPGDLKMCAVGAPGWQPDWNCPQNLPANPGVIVDGDTSIACTEYDYPSQEQFLAARIDQNKLFIFLTTLDVADFYKHLSEDKLQQPPAFHQVIQKDSSNIVDALIQALQGVAEVACPETTTPAPETTTPAPETTTPAPETTTPAPETTTPAPAPETTTPAPAPETTTPAPAPETTTTPAPAPETTTTPAPAPETTTTPAPAPETTTTPAPAPETTTTPAPAPETTTTPAPAPETTTTPAPVVTTAGSPETPPVTMPTVVPPVTGGECNPICEDRCHCDELVIKVGPALKELHVDYEN